ncbi:MULTISPECIES: ABC transporter ATP-binding protein [unclassified Aureimonas]|uniref:ABC transporter ATP-binding protein n=1 Tax=unclassified Aureimonas TaxID=2615206 RepID=UPI0006FA80E5|nr:MULTISPECIES: ABC transporter ATP-binding protein [unclassified Aureimonas]KQT57357.1 sugar ABC transporter ATP-binding protein [Aureimonas sp. Leaf427]KQT77035.1 sugar ABC transporter ATP-binding protein [Aureimonas sp. Leaf460]
MAEITIEHVTKRFGAFTAVDDIDMRFADGEVACLLGPSGCGKTTLMRMLAGLERPTTGRVLFGGRDVTALPPRKRNVGMVFQYPVMYPTLSVAENIALPMVHDRDVSAAERQRRVDEVLDVLDIRSLGNAFIEDLDAGTRQKVAVGRAVARQSEIVLFDEPTTNVEVNAKLQLIRAFKLVTQRLRQTIVYVTHDQTEAMTLADRIALMKSGRILQYDKPQVLYNEPTSEFGGWFLGNPGMNFVAATLSNGLVASPILAEPLPAPANLPTSAKITVGIRPERVRMTGEPVAGSVPARLMDQAIGIAGRYLTRARIGETDIKVNTERRPPAPLGGTVHLSVPRERLMLFADGIRFDS